jgi:RNA-directed DNA polymerase
VEKAKSFDIPRKLVWEAYKRVKSNKGAAGVDDQSIAEFEKNLRDNLYRIWNRMSSGSYFPPPVRMVEIPKSDGKKRMLGIPTVSDRVAQMVVKMTLEVKIEPYFHPDSYGYRPNKSAVDALGVARRRCWDLDWVIDLDIKGFFDNINHDLLMRALRKHTKSKWVLLYIERWLKVSGQKADGTLVKREKGTPQGGVISPLLANLFLHYALDEWLRRNYPSCAFERYADDSVVHCRSEPEAIALWAAIERRLGDCGLELHPEKTKVVYCKDDARRKDYENTKFDFLGYTFRSRLSKNKFGRFFVNFSPAISNKAKKAIREEIRNWGIPRKSDKSLEDIARMFDPIIRGWINYYGRFYRSELFTLYDYLNVRLALWATRKFKRLRGRRRRATHWLGRIALKQPKLFAHWQWVRPAIG